MVNGRCPTIDVKNFMERKQPKELARLLNTPDAYSWLREQYRQGALFVPVGGKCDLFSYEYGCPGHSDTGELE